MTTFIIVMQTVNPTPCTCSDARSAQVSHLIKWHSGPCSEWVPRDTPTTVVVNPPWGLRLLNDAENAESDQDIRGILHTPGLKRCSPELLSLLLLMLSRPGCHSTAMKKALWASQTKQIHRKRSAVEVDCVASGVGKTMLMLPLCLY